jgi:hypothetical protein
MPAERCMTTMVTTRSSSLHPSILIKVDLVVGFLVVKFRKELNHFTSVTHNSHVALKSSALSL